MARIAFIGLGKMGGPMATNLVRAQHQVAGFDTDPASCSLAAEQGIAVTRSAREAAEMAEAIITMLPSGTIVRRVIRELLPAVRPGTLFIDCSTIDIAEACEIAAVAQQSGQPMLDAPVSGGVAGATAGTLTFMVGGLGEAYACAHPILSAMGSRIVHCGSNGLGQAAKICNNMVAGISLVAVSEAFLLARALGLPDQVFYDVASASSAQCWALTTQCPVPGPVPSSAANRDFAPGFAAELMLKDLRLGQAAADRARLATPMGSLAARLYEDYAAHGGVGRDFAGIIEWISTLDRDPCLQEEWHA